MLKTKDILFFFAMVAILVFPKSILADYGYLTMPVSPSALSYSGGNTGINSWFDHSSPQGLNDNSSTMTRSDGRQFFGASAALATSTSNPTSTCSNFFGSAGCYNGHEGIDYAVASGTPVLAAAAGTVQQAQWWNPADHSKDFGLFVRIWHSLYSVSTLYAHLSATTSTALARSNVARQQLVGYSGGTGDAAGHNHLHFQTYDADVWVSNTSTDHFVNSVDPYGWTGTGTDPWNATDTPYGYMWASKFATSSVYNYVSGTITNATSWKANQIYIIQGALTVSSSATLTIPAGVVVKFDAPTDYFEVYGTLKVNGTASSSVYFTSIKDDTVGGDTNDDATATLPATTDWRYIRFNAGSSSTINYATIRYAGNNTGVNPDIYVFDGNLTINSSTLDDADYGLYMASGTVSINNSTISNCPGSGILADTAGKLTLKGNKFINNVIATDVEFGNGNPIIFNPPSNNTSSGTGENGYHIGGTLGLSQTWSQDIPYDTNDIIVPSTSSLTMNPGTIMKFVNAASLKNTGILKVLGASTSSIYFTSYKDDSVGGDTNGDGTSSVPAPGDWDQIETDSGATTTINYAKIRYGGEAPSINAGLYENGGSFTVTNSTVSSSQYYGVYIASGTINVSTSTFANNPLDGIFNNTTVTSTAQYDYWNASSGPSGVATGSGDGVTSYVNYTPFATSVVP